MKHQIPTETFLQHFGQKNIIFSDISLPVSGKNMSRAKQSMTESQKNSAMSKQDKKFSCILKKYNNN